MNTITGQRGFSLTEALIAFTIVAVGLLSVATFQSSLFRQSAYNKARTEALALAQQKIEQLKHYTQAREDNYIDENDDGLLDADGTYTENPVEGQNATFTRSWDLSTNTLGKAVSVSVAWNDADGQNQSVLLAADIPWLSPRTAADQIVDLEGPRVVSPTGRATLGEGNLSNLPSDELVRFPNIYPDDGLDIYQYGEDLLLTNDNQDILLTLEKACSTQSGECTDFVRISGTVYIDMQNARQNAEELRVLVSDAGYCQRWVPEGTLASPPTTAHRDYEYYHYTCYLGGGWHGNIGFVKDSGLQLRDKFCQGDPTAFNAWEQPVIALRRSYRGMLKKTFDGATKYYSHGIADATQLDGQDFVFTELPIEATEGYQCGQVDAPMTRRDSSSGNLFKGVPTDFVCLNADYNDDALPDNLDWYDASRFSADTTCPFDPTSPPVGNHQISGAFFVQSSRELSLADFQMVTSDGPGNCGIVGYSSAEGGYVGKYVCTVYDWGSGWTGAVALRESSDWHYCPTAKSVYTNLTADASQNFECAEAATVVVEGTLTYLADNADITSMVIENSETGTFGVCEFIATKYRCVAPVEGETWSGTITAYSGGYMCAATEGIFALSGLTSEFSPYTMNMTVAKNANLCPVDAGGL